MNVVTFTLKKEFYSCHVDGNTPTAVATPSFYRASQVSTVHISWNMKAAADRNRPRFLCEILHDLLFYQSLLSAVQNLSDKRCKREHQSLLLVDTRCLRWPQRMKPKRS